MKTRSNTTLKKHSYELGVNVAPRVMFMSGPATKIKKWKEPPRVIHSIERIYRNLFNAPQDPSTINELIAAVKKVDRNNPDSKNAANAILRRLNDDKEPPFDIEQLILLGEVLESNNALSPVNPDPMKALVGQRFFQQLVFGPIDDVYKLWELLHAYKLDDPRSKEDVVNWLVKMLPNSTWTDEQLNALYKLAVTNPDFKSLAWWDTVDDAW